jgi:subtilase family serine protease
MVTVSNKGTYTDTRRGSAMRRKKIRIMQGAAVLAVALTSAGAVVAVGGTASAAGTAAARTAATGTAAAAARTAAGTETVRPDAPGSPAQLPFGQVPITNAQCEAELNINCYVPNQIEAAYNLPALYNRGITGKGTTIVIIDAYGSPTISDDLASFDAYLGLGAPPFKVVKYGNVPAFDSSNGDMVGWAGETSLDVEYAHAGAPGAKIVLVEAANDDFSTLVGAVNYAVSHRLGDVISMSWGWSEQDSPADSGQYAKVFTAAAKAHITVVASSGDTGASGYNNNGNYISHPVVSWPASDPNVTAVGGTQLNLNASGQRAGEDSAWNDTYDTNVQDDFFGNDGPNPFATGGGKSVIFHRPSYQNSVRSVTGNSRGVPDISMSASGSSSVNVYETWFGVDGGWTPTAGTSESAPMFAAIVALATQEAGHPLGLINPALYKLAAEHAPGIVPVASGNNTVSFGNTTVHGYSVKHSYNLATGLGTANGEYLVPELAKLG